MPQTIINILRAKLYLGNIRKAGLAKVAIDLQEEYLRVEAGRKIRGAYDPNERYWKKLWINEVSNMFSSRGIRVHHNNSNVNSVTGNKTIIDVAIKYAEMHNLKLPDLQDINFVWKKKQVYLSFELVGELG